MANGALIMSLKGHFLSYRQNTVSCWKAFKLSKVQNGDTKGVVRNRKSKKDK